MVVLAAVLVAPESMDQDPVVVALGHIADALTRLAVVAERAYPPPPDRSQVRPADESAFSRPKLTELTQWEQDDHLARSRLP